MAGTSGDQGEAMAAADGSSERRGRGRPADPVAAESEDAARRAEALRALVDDYRDRQRAITGRRPTYGEVAASIHYSAATLSRALKYGIVSREVALAIFTMCRGPEAHGAAWWLALNGDSSRSYEASAAATLSTSSSDLDVVRAASPDGSPEVASEPSQPEPDDIADPSTELHSNGDAGADCEPPARPTSVSDTQVAQTPRPQRGLPPATERAHRRGVLISAAIGLAVAIVATIVIGGIRGDDDSDRPTQAQQSGLNTTPTLVSAAPTTLGPTTLPGGPSVPQERESGGQPAVLTPPRPEFGTGCTGYPWFPDYAAAQNTLAGLPPSEREGVGVRTGTEVRFSVQGATANAVLLERARIVVDARRPVTGVRLDNHACGSTKIQAKFAVDLRPTPPRLTAEPGSDQGIAIPKRPFPFSVSSTDTEDLVFGVTGIDGDVEWHIEIDWESMGSSGILRVDDHGSPFRTTSAPTAKCGPGFTACNPPTAETP